MTVKIKLVREGVKLPEYARIGDAGMDVVAAENVTIRPGETVVVPTGISVAIPKGYELQVRPRSGVSLKTKLRVANAPGTIDSGYRGEIGVIMTNTSDKWLYSAGDMKLTYSGKYSYSINGKGINTSNSSDDGTYVIEKGDRIAQIVLKQFETIDWEVCEELDETERGADGYGSTGV